MRPSRACPAARSIGLGHRRRIPLGRRCSPKSADRRGGELAGARDARGALAPGAAGNLDRHRHDHDRSDTARLGTGLRRGRTDTERLQTGELVYAGVRRTPICALATELPLRGIPTGLAAEIFASTLDVYLILGDIESEPDNRSTADGRPATVDAARDRLARMVGADRDSFSALDAISFAQAADQCLIERLRQAAERACAATIGKPAAAVISGSGSFLARRLADRLIDLGGPVISLKEAWGEVASAAGCAFALLALAAERLDGDPRRTESRKPACSRRIIDDPTGPGRRQGRRQPVRLARVSESSDGLPRDAPGTPTALNATVLIAGGGPAADWIRSLDQIHGLGDVAADRLAVHALDLTAAFLARLLPGSIVVDRLEMLEAACHSRSNTILAPRHASGGDRTLRRKPSSCKLGRDLRRDRRADCRASGGPVARLAEEHLLPEGATRQDAATARIG